MKTTTNDLELEHIHINISKTLLEQFDKHIPTNKRSKMIESLIREWLSDQTESK